MANGTEIADIETGADFDPADESQETPEPAANGKARRARKPKVAKSAPTPKAARTNGKVATDVKPTAAEKREAARLAKEAAKADQTARAAMIAGMRPVCLMLKQVGDPTRAAILMLLSESPLNVGAICAALGGVSQPAVSHHLALLRHGRVIAPKRSGKNNIYELEDDGRRLAQILKTLAKSSG